MKTISIIDWALVAIGLIFGITMIASNQGAAGGIILIFTANLIFTVLQKRVVRKREQRYEDFITDKSLTHIWEQYKKEYNEKSKENI